MSRRFSAGAYLLALALAPAILSSQIRPLHTRDATRLSEVQVTHQLEQSDVIFIPVGAVESNGILPSDRDYVSALGFAIAMAEETGGLYMPGLAHSFPGTTVVGNSTVYMSPSQGLTFLKGLARSLLRQGFRRQVYVSVSQGPAPLTVGTLARQFFEEEHVPILYIDLDTQFEKLGLSRDDHSKTIYGAHLLAGRLEDLPVKGDYAESVSHAENVPQDKGLSKLGELGLSGSLTLGSCIADTMAHGGPPTLAADAAERQKWGEIGREQIRSIVKKMHMNEAMTALREHDEFTQKVIIPKFKDRLPLTIDSL